MSMGAAARGGVSGKNIAKLERQFYFYLLIFTLIYTILYAKDDNTITFKNGIGYIRVFTEQQANDDKYGVEIQICAGKENIKLLGTQEEFTVRGCLSKQEMGLVDQRQKSTPWYLKKSLKNKKTV